jgi:hypothetical protein
VQEIEVGIKKLGVGKEKDLVELQVEYLKWGSKTLAPHIMKIFNNIIQRGFPTDWTTSLAIPFFKSGDVNNPSNYRTIMINPLFAKLFGSMLENRINKWTEEGDKRVNTVPKDELWHRMEEIGVPIHLRAAVHKHMKRLNSKL